MIFLLQLNSVLKYSYLEFFSFLFVEWIFLKLMQHGGNSKRKVARILCLSSLEKFDYILHFYFYERKQNKCVHLSHCDIITINEFLSAKLNLFYIIDGVNLISKIFF